jgi:hypothetical protein
MEEGAAAVAISPRLELSPQSLPRAMRSRARMHVTVRGWTPTRPTFQRQESSQGVPLKLIFPDPNPDGTDQEVVWARGRLPNRTYVHRSFTLQLAASRDHGCAARYIVEVFDQPAPADPSEEELEREEWIVHTTPGSAGKSSCRSRGRRGRFES